MWGGIAHDSVVRIMLYFDLFQKYFFSRLSLALSEYNSSVYFDYFISLLA